ncbi:type II toxin-antitoxin system PemK/MazF family toxin [Enterococcus faecium]
MDKPKEFPKQGDIITINFNPSTGRVIQKRRPALVVSTNNYNLVTGLVAVCPITSTKK